MKRVIRLGDPHTHGGKVITAAPNTEINGKRVARLGDKAVCPKKGHGVVTIVEGDPSWSVEGQSVALEGHKCSCGCSLISTLPTLGRSFEGAGSTSMGTSPNVEAAFRLLAPSGIVSEVNKPAVESSATSSPVTPVSERLPSPDDAPARVDFSSMQKDFEKQWANSFPRGKSQEHGGTIVSDATGNMRLTNTRGGKSGSFSPKLSTKGNESVEGIFHTHPYDESEGGFTGVSLSGGDAGYMINSQHKVIVAQSGRDQFMYMRTTTTPGSVDADALNNAQNNRISELVGSGTGFGAATEIAAEETARKYGLAYYKGQGGVFNRVYP